MKDRMTIENYFGVSVKKCCASCAHKDLTRLMESRWCCKKVKKVRASGCCPMWKMSGQLRMAGFVRGKVKCNEYLRTVLAEREDQWLAEDMGISYEAKSIEQMRTTFEAKYGSIYVKF